LVTLDFACFDQCWFC